MLTDIRLVGSDSKHGTSLAFAPEPLLLQLLKQRLEQADCKKRGWVLVDFPVTRVHALLLQSSAIFADRVILLDLDDDTLAKRAKQR